MTGEEDKVLKLLDEYKNLSPRGQLRFLEVMRRERRNFLLERKAKSIKWRGEKTTAYSRSSSDRGVSINFGPRPKKDNEDNSNSKEKTKSLLKPR